MLRLFKAARRKGGLSEIFRCRTATPQWIRLTAAYVGFPFRPFSVQLSSGRFEFLERSDVATFWQIFFRRVYPVRESDRLVVDAGANIGAFSLFTLLQNPECRVIAVEPSPAARERLRAVLKANQVYERCRVMDAALGPGDGLTTISDSGSSQFRMTGAGGIPVRMVRVDSVLQLAESVDLLKMDIEGAEYETLGAATDSGLRRIRRLVLEYHPVAAVRRPWPELRQRLISVGFRVTAESDDGGGYGMAYLENRKPAD